MYDKWWISHRLRDSLSALKRSGELWKTLFEGALAFTWHKWTPMLVGTSFLWALWSSCKLKACQIKQGGSYSNQCFGIGSIDAICSIVFQCQVGRRNPITFKGRTWLHNSSKKTFGWMMISKAVQISLIENRCNFHSLYVRWISLIENRCNFPFAVCKVGRNFAEVV